MSGGSGGLDRRTVRAVLQAAPFPTAVLDHRLVLVAVNAAMEELTHRSAADLEGRTPHELFGAHTDALRHTAEHVLRTGERAGPLQMDRAGPHGEVEATFEVWVHPVLHEVDDDAPPATGLPDGVVVPGVVATVRDLTTATRAERRTQVVSAATRALAAAGTREEVVAVVQEALVGPVAAAVTLDLLDATPTDGAVDGHGATDGDGDGRLAVPVHATGGALLGHLRVEVGRRGPLADHDVELVRTVARVAGASLTRVDLTELIMQDRFRRALDAMLDDVVIAGAVRDTGGAVVDFEVTHTNGDGTRPLPAVGRSLRSSAAEWPGAALFEEFRSVVEHRRPVAHDQVELRHPSASDPLWWRLQAVPFGDGFLATVRDVTDEVLARRELDDARLRRNTERESVRLLQQLALPDRLPWADGVQLAAHYRSADASVPVGGDWYDAFELPGGRIGLVIGDVAGHGRESAVTMVRLRTLVAMAAATGESPSAVLERVHLAVGSDASSFTTCTYAVVDPAAGTVVVARAGHPPLLVATHPPDGRLVRVGDVPGGLPFGVSTGAVYQDTLLVARGPTTLVLYTDGLVERRHRPVDDGVAALAHRLTTAPGDTAVAVCEWLVDGVADDPIEDDFCVLVCRIEPPVAEPDGADQ